jgi:Domain of unknown function (DUF4412)
MKRLFAVGLFTLLSINPLFTAPAEEKSDNPLADAPTQYSADLVVSRKVGTPVTMRVYIDGNKRRTEQAANGGTIVILRGDLGKRYVLNTSTKTYMELPLDPRMMESTADWSKRLGIVHEKVGTEDINGETCIKYRFSADQSKTQNQQRQQLMPRAQGSVTGFIWVGQTTHMLLKSENPVSTAEWKNVKLGAPEASLFELPADYNKQEAPNQFGAQKPAAEKSDADKSGEQKPNEMKPSPSPTEEKSDGQKSDGDKSGEDKDKQ